MEVFYDKETFTSLSLSYCKSLISLDLYMLINTGKYVNDLKHITPRDSSFYLSLTSLCASPANRFVYNQVNPWKKTMNFEMR